MTKQKLTRGLGRTRHRMNQAIEKFQKLKSPDPKSAKQQVAELRARMADSFYAKSEVAA